MAVVKRFLTFFSSYIDFFQNLFMKMSTSSICQVAFGMEPDSMCSSKDEFLDFFAAIDVATSLTAWRFVDISWKIKKFLNIGHETILKEKIRVIDDFLYKIIYYKIEEASKKSNNHVSRIRWKVACMHSNLKLEIVLFI